MLLDFDHRLKFRSARNEAGKQLCEDLKFACTEVQGVGPELHNLLRQVEEFLDNTLLFFEPKMKLENLKRDDSHNFEWSVEELIQDIELLIQQIQFVVDVTNVHAVQRGLDDYLAVVAEQRRIGESVKRARVKSIRLFISDCESLEDEVTEFTDTFNKLKAESDDIKVPLLVLRFFPFFLFSV
jgi:hypothetical protein